jgi:hypothetical protein
MPAVVFPYASYPKGPIRRHIYLGVFCEKVNLQLWYLNCNAAGTQTSIYVLGTKAKIGKVVQFSGNIGT